MVSAWWSSIGRGVRTTAGCWKIIITARREEKEWDRVAKGCVMGEQVQQ